MSLRVTHVAGPPHPPDHSQVLRRTIQLAFLFLNVWLGVAFYFWVRRMETGAPGRIVVRPTGVERWLLHRRPHECPSRTPEIFGKSPSGRMYRMSGVGCRVPGRRRPATRAGAMNAFSQSRSTSG